MKLMVEDKTMEGRDGGALQVDEKGMLEKIKRD
jgi:hypothetical protein